MHVCMCVCIYIYTYKERERESASKRNVSGDRRCLAAPLHDFVVSGFLRARH